MEELKLLLEEVRSLRRQVERFSLDLTDNPRRVTVIYCNRKHGSLWYRLNGEEVVKIAQDSIKGYAVRLELAIKERRGKEAAKLELTMDCVHSRYRLETGIETEFAKSLIQCLAALPPEQFRYPIRIMPQEGNDESVLFARVKRSDSNGLEHTVFVENRLPDNVALEQAISNVEQAFPHEQPQTEEEPKTDCQEDPQQPALKNRERFQLIAGWTGHKPGQIRALSQQLSLPSSSESLTPEQAHQLRNALFVDWSAGQGAFKHAKHAWNAFNLVQQGLPTDAPDKVLWDAWKQDIARRNLALEGQKELQLAP